MGSAKMMDRYQQPTHAWAALEQLCSVVEAHFETTDGPPIDIDGVEAWLPSALLHLLEAHPQATRALNAHAHQKLRAGAVRTYSVEGQPDQVELALITSGTSWGESPWLRAADLDDQPANEVRSALDQYSSGRSPRESDQIYGRSPTMEPNAKFAYPQGLFSYLLLHQWMAALTKFYPQVGYGSGDGFAFIAKSLGLSATPIISAGEHQLQCDATSAVYQGPARSHRINNIQYGGSRVATRHAGLTWSLHQHHCTLSAPLIQGWVHQTPPPTIPPPKNADRQAILRVLVERMEPRLPSPASFPAPAVALFPPDLRDWLNGFPKSVAALGRCSPALTSQHVGRRAHATYEGEAIELVQIAQSYSGAIAPMSDASCLTTEAATEGDDRVFIVRGDDYGNNLVAHWVDRLPEWLSWAWALPFCQLVYPAAVEREARGSPEYAMELLQLADAPVLAIADGQWALITDTAALFVRRFNADSYELRYGGPVHAISVLSRIQNQTPYLRRLPGS